MTMSKSLALWKGANSRNIPKTVGRFFEEASRVLFRGSYCQTNLDIQIAKIATGVEVKSGDSCNELRLLACQLERHLQLSFGFPFDHLLYCLFCYTSRSSRKDRNRRGQRYSLLSRCKTEMEVWEVLAQRTRVAYILHSQVLAGLMNVQGVKKGQLPCHPELETLSLGRKILTTFNEHDAEATLCRLGLSPKKWVIRERLVMLTIHIGLYPHQLPLRVVEVLPTSFCQEYDRAIKVPKNGRLSRRTLRIDKKKVVAA